MLLKMLVVHAGMQFFFLVSEKELLVLCIVWVLRIIALYLLLDLSIYWNWVWCLSSFGPVRMQVLKHVSVFKNKNRKQESCFIERERRTWRSFLLWNRKERKKKASKAGNGKHEMLSNRLLNRSSSYFKPTHCWKMKFVAPALTNSFGCVVGSF